MNIVRKIARGVLCGTVDRMNVALRNRHLKRLRKLSYETSEEILQGYLKHDGLLRRSKLTPDEERTVDELWMKNCGVTPEHSFYELIKTVSPDGFDPMYVPNVAYWEYLLPRLNPATRTIMLDDKSSYRLLFGDVRRPRELVRCVDGVCFSADDRVLSCRDAVSEVVAYGQPVIVKPTSDSGCGKGVQFISDFAPYRLTKLFEEYGRNFVVQQLVRQSGETAVFNPTSLNTFRVSSLFMNGVFSIQSIIMRVGGRGSRVDNVGAGGFAVGVEQDGRLMNFGYGKDGKVNEGYNGEKFDSCRIRSLGNVIDLVESCHKRIPWVPYVGWDVALDDTGNGVLIELNSGFPGILYEQLCTGPLFSPGNRFDEVMEYARMHSPDAMPSLYYLRSDFYHSHAWQ